MAEGTRAPVIARAVFVKRRCSDQHHRPIAQLNRAAELQRVPAVVIGCYQPFAIQRGKQAVEQLVQLGQGIAVQELLDTLQAISVLTAGQRPGHADQHDRHHCPPAHEPGAQAGRKGDPLEVPLPLLAVDRAAHQQQQGEHAKHGQVWPDRGLTGVVELADQDHQARRNHRPPDTIHPEDMPGSVVPQEPEQYGEKQNEDQIVLGDPFSAQHLQPGD